MRHCLAAVDNEPLCVVSVCVRFVANHRMGHKRSREDSADSGRLGEAEEGAEGTYNLLYVP